MSEEGQAADKAAEEKKVQNNATAEAEAKPQGDGAANKEAPGAATGAKSEQAVSEETLKLPAEEMVKRRSRWQSSLAALRYVSSVSRDNEVKIRDTDRATSLALLIVCMFALLCLVLPMLAGTSPQPLSAIFSWMATQRMPLVLVADVLVGATLLMYVANRFGIVTTLTPRQALLTWQLMLGSSLLGIFMAINLGLIIAYVVANTHISLQ